MLLTHRDDVADADRYARRFGARVWIHAADRSAAPWASDIFDGDETSETSVAPGVVAMPVPGHTRGSVIYLVDETWAFTGDSLAWSLDHDDLTAFRGACWYSWAHQTRSLSAFAVPPPVRVAAAGPRRPDVATPDEMAARLVDLVDRMVAGN